VKSNTLLSESAHLRAYHATCAQGCKRSDCMGVAVNVPDGAAVAGKAFLSNGWHHLDEKWYCAQCWTRIVSLRGVDADVTRAIQRRGYALGIEVRK
jgi:hypothetical protein